MIYADYIYTRINIKFNRSILDLTKENSALKTRMEASAGDLELVKVNITTPFRPGASKG